MKILITGGSGFIGQNLREYLVQKNYDVYAPDSTELNCLNEEAVFRCLKAVRYDIIFHFVVYGDGIDKKKDGSKMLEYNLRIFWNFAKYHELYGKMICAGSGAEYNKQYPIEYVTEEDLYFRPLPVDQYGLMKYTVNSFIESSDNIYNLRLFGVFGKYEHWKSKFISNLCCKSIYGLPLSMRQNCYFDYLWIDDLCVIMEKFMLIEQPEYHVYNATSGKRIDLCSIAEIVRNISNENLPVIICRDGLANEYTANNGRLLKELPDIKFTPIEKTIPILYRWYEKHRKEIDIYSLIYI